jgi:multidrug efflux system membrane fusion protein
LVFSDEGQLGIRIADADSKARFVPIEIVEDGRSSVWITGIEGATRVIVVGQDFVKDGDPVEAVSAAEADSDAEPPA